MQQDYMCNLFFLLLKLERQLNGINQVAVLIHNDCLYLSQEILGLAFEVCANGHDKLMDFMFLNPLTNSKILQTKLNLTTILTPTSKNLNEVWYKMGVWDMISLESSISEYFSWPLLLLRYDESALCADQNLNQAYKIGVQDMIS